MLPLSSRKRSFCWTDSNASLGGLSSEARAQKIYGKLDRRYSIEVYSLTSFLTGYTITSLHTLLSASKQHTTSDRLVNITLNQYLNRDERDK